MSDSLLLWYSLVETSRNIGIDTLNKKYNMKNNEVYSVMDENYGFVAEFKEKSFLFLPEVPEILYEKYQKTFSYWIKLGKNELNGYIHQNGQDSKTFGSFIMDGNTLVIESQGEIFITGIKLENEKWYHVCISIYENMVYISINGKAIEKMEMEIYTTNSLTIGNNVKMDSGISGRMVDFRVYEGNIGDEKIYELYEKGPEINTFSYTAYTHLIDLYWDFSKRRVNSYTILDGKGQTIVSNSTGFSTEVSQLKPNTIYTFNLYTDADPTIVSKSISVRTPTINNSSVKQFMDRIGSDLSILPPSVSGQLSGYLASVMSTGDDLKLSSGKKAKFVRNSETIGIIMSGPESNLLTSFDPDSGSGQNFSFNVDGSSTYTIDYNELTNKMTHNGIEYSPEEYFKLDLYKIQFKET